MIALFAWGATRLLADTTGEAVTTPTPTGPDSTAFPGTPSEIADEAIQAGTPVGGQEPGSPTEAMDDPADQAQGPACREAAGQAPPAEAQHVRAYGSDVTGDGMPDDLWVYVMRDGNVFLHASFASGGSARGAIEASTTGAADILGTTAPPSGGRLVWLNLGTGASAPLVGLARVEDCTVRQVVTEGGEPLELWAGGSARLRAGVDCREDEVTAWIYDLAWDEGAARPLVDEPGELTVHRYRLHGAVAALEGTQRQAGRVFEEALAGFRCAPLE